MKQYLALCERIISEGVWVENERTGKRCLTVINADLAHDRLHIRIVKLAHLVMLNCGKPKQN